MSQVQASERMVAVIIARLASNGVYVEPLMASKFLPNPDYSDKVLYESTMDWLEAEGIVRTDKHYMGGPITELIRDAVLSSKGYSVLSQKQPNGLTLAENVKRIAAGPGAAAMAGEFVGSVLGSLTKSLSSG